jgi:hypothetical protein
VVGVARNTKIWSPTQASQPCLYLPPGGRQSTGCGDACESKFPLGAIHALRNANRAPDPLCRWLRADFGTAAGDRALFPQRIALVMLGVFSISGIYHSGVGTPG